MLTKKAIIIILYRSNTHRETIMNIFLPDGAKLELEAGATAFDVANTISKGLAKNALAAEVNGKLADIYAPVGDNDKVTILKTKYH